MIEEIIGLSEDEAYLKMRDIAQRRGVRLSIRIEKRDDVEYELKTDYRQWRFNLSIKNGIITNVRMG